MKKILALLLTFVITAVSPCVFAAETAVDGATGIISVSGVAEPDARVMLVVLKEGKTADDLTNLAPENLTEVVEHINQTKSDADGYFEFTYANGYGDNYGRFVALVNTTNVPYEVENLEIKYYTDNTSAALTDQIIKMTDKDSVEALIDADTISILGLDTAFYDVLDADARETVYDALAHMTDGDQDDLKEVFYFSGALVFINGSSDFESIYSLVDDEGITDEVMGFDKSHSLYKGIKDTSALEDRILDLIPADDIDTFRAGAREAYALELIKNYKYTFTKKIITEFNDVLELDLDLLTSSNETRVFKALAGNSYDSADELSEAFEDAAEDASGSGGSGSGGSSGGRGGSSVGGNFSGAGKGGSFGGATAPAPEAQAPTAQEKSFSDMPEGHYASEAVSALVKKGVISGYPDGSFAPDRAVNRMEFIKMLVTAFDIEKTEAASYSYTDLRESDWYYDYCVAAISKGILNGVSETEVGADRAVTRQDVCVLLARMLEVKGVSLDKKADVSFTDADSISDYARDSVSLFAEAGIVSGSDGAFAPLSAASRAECAKIIYNVLMEVMG